MESRKPQLEEPSVPVRPQLAVPLAADEVAYPSRTAPAIDPHARARAWRASLERVVFGLALGVAALVVSTRIALEVSKNVFSAWSSFRLGFSAQLAAGIDLYPALGTGPVIGNIYGPMTAVFYLPALLASKPTWQVLCGQLYTVAWVGGLLVVACVMRARAARIGALPGGCVAVMGLAAMLALPGLRHCLVQIHADAPSLVFGALSCLVWRDADRFDPKRSAASAALWALAVLSKQQALFVLVGQLVLLWRWFGLRSAASHAAFALIALCLSFYGAAFALGSQPGAIWFFLISLPALHKLQASREWLALSRSVALLVPLLAFWCATWTMTRTRPGAVARRDVLLLAAASLALVPISLLAGIKEGGYLNNYHAHYYALVAACLAAVDALSRRRATISGRPRSVLAALTLASTLLVPTDLYGELPGLKDTLRGLDESPHERASAYLREHGDAYFTWHTLENAQVLGRAYHSFDGLRTLRIGGVVVSKKDFAKFAPASPRYLVFPKEGRGIPSTLNLVKRYYPGYRKINPPDELKGFVVYSR